MENIEKEQKEVCLQHGSSFVASEANEKVGIALDTLSQLPLNALRHPPEGDTCGWYIWGGEEMSEISDFFQPLHVSHLNERCPEIIKFLALAPGWRVLLAGNQVDIWYDETLLNI